MGTSFDNRNYLCEKCIWDVLWIFTLATALITLEERCLWPILQPTTQGWWWCLGFTFCELSCRLHIQSMVIANTQCLCPYAGTKGFYSNFLKWRGVTDSFLCFNNCRIIKVQPANPALPFIVFTWHTAQSNADIHLLHIWLSTLFALLTAITFVSPLVCLPQF